MEEKLRHSLEDHDSFKVINLNGSISSITIDVVIKMVEEISQKINIILNMSNVLMITSSGIKSLAELSMDVKKKGKRVLFMRVRPDIIRLIEQLDLYDYFIFVESVEEGELKLKYYT